MFNPELTELKQRYNILLEQYQKLQGTIKVLQATTDELQTSLEKAEKNRDKYKKAFEDIFTNNIGDEWERLPEEEKKSMSIENKLSFFENEMNSSKLYIRRKMTELMESTAEKNKKLENDVSMLKAQLLEKETQLKNLIDSGGAGLGIATPKIENSLLGNDEVGATKATPRKASMPQGTGSKKDMKSDLMKDIAGLVGMVDGSQKGAASPVAAPKESHSETAKPSIHQEPKKPETKEPVAPPKPSIPKTPPKTETQSAKQSQPTTNFFLRFGKLPEEQKAAYKAGVASLDAMVEKINLGRKVLMIFGSTGFYTVEDIFKYGIEHGDWEESKTEENRIRRSIASLAATGKNGAPPFLVVTESKDQSVGKGRGKKCYLLSSAGEAWYALTTWNDPMKSLSIVRAKEQKSVGHAELIQKMIKTLNDAGFETYQEVSLPTKTTGECSIADISANKGQCMNIRIECEMGNYDLQKYVYKFAKALEVSDRLLVGVPTQNVKAKIIDAIKELIRSQFRGLDNFVKDGKSYKVFTLEELNKCPNLILPDDRSRGGC